MGYCKLCKADVTADCLLNTGECVFCFYDTADWESNGIEISKKESVKLMKRVRALSNVRVKKL